MKRGEEMKKQLLWEEFQSHKETVRMKKKKGNINLSLNKESLNLYSVNSTSDWIIFENGVVYQASRVWPR